jgi:Protein of unknown function (DUF1376)
LTDSERPPPLVPVDVDLRDFPGMWLDVDRVLKSETWRLGSSDEKAAAITLWMESWHEVPAASLPNNDRLLAKLSQAEKWKAAREHALRGWVECNDGRLYHPVVAEKALAAWIEKLASAIAGAAGNAKRWNVAIDTDRLRAQFVAAADALRRIDPASKTLKKKAVVMILAGSQPESGPESHGDSPPESPPDGPKASPPDRNREGEGEGLDIPQPPEGGKARRRKSEGPVGLKAWLAAIKARGEKAIPDDDPVLAYALRIGLPHEFLHLAWQQFRHRYLRQHPGKRYTDWRRVFRNSVEGNWLKLWWLDPATSAYALTTVGLQAQRDATGGREAA